MGSSKYLAKYLAFNILPSCSQTSAQQIFVRQTIAAEEDFIESNKKGTKWNDSMANQFKGQLSAPFEFVNDFSKNIFIHIKVNTFPFF